MCGRYALTVSGRVLAEALGLEVVPEVAPRYNIAPTQQVGIVRADREGGRKWASAHWGLIPSWAKDAGIGARMINARGETITEKPAFRSAAKRRRCLIPADLFYEWKREETGKQPFAIRLTDGRPFAMAGLWERWPGAGAEPVESCTIITTAANGTVAPLHDRMPVILPPTAFAEWLSGTELPQERLAALLVPYPESEMETFPVCKRVNSPANDDPECLRPAPAERA